MTTSSHNSPGDGGKLSISQLVSHTTTPTGLPGSSEDKWLTREPAAKVLGISVSTLRRRYENVEIVAVTTGGVHRFRESDVLQLADRLRRMRDEADACTVELVEEIRHSNDARRLDDIRAVLQEHFREPGVGLWDPVEEGAFVALRMAQMLVHLQKVADRRRVPLRVPKGDVQQVAAGMVSFLAVTSAIKAREAFKRARALGFDGNPRANDAADPPRRRRGVRSPQHGQRDLLATPEEERDILALWARLRPAPPPGLQQAKRKRSGRPGNS